MSSPHLEVVLTRIQRIVSTVSKAQPPLTEHEALEQIVEELELAGFAAAEFEPEREAAAHRV